MQMTIFGCGYSGRAIASAAHERGASVTGTARTGEKAGFLASIGIRGGVFDGESLDNALQSRLFDTTHLVQSIPPSPAGDPLLKLVAGRLKAICPKLEWIGYLSTVGCYGDHGGAWVDEENECHPPPGRSQIRMESENAWTEEGHETGLPVAVLRLAGIYGPGRNAFVNLARGTARRIIKKDQIFNRVRVEDIADTTLFLAQEQQGGLFNVSDNEPAPAHHVIEEAARLMGVEPPPEEPFENALMSPMARSFYSANKRVSNRAIRQRGYVFHYPEYRMSLRQLWQSGSWNAEI